MQRVLPCGLALLVLLAGCTGSRNTADPAAVSRPPEAEPAAGDTSDASDSPFKPYREVVTDAAVSDDGLFAVHRVGEKLYFEIPDSLLGRDMLLISRIAQVPTDLSPYLGGGAKVNEQVVAWERHRNRLLLRTRSFSSVAEDSLPVYRAVRNNNFEPILQAFEIQALSEDSAGAVIDVTDLFTQDVPALSGLSNGLRQQYQVRRLDPARSFVTEARSFPINVEVRHAMTYEAGSPPGDGSTGTISMQMSQSLVLLPAIPMRPRLADPRVGYFTIRQVDFGSDEQKAATQQFIRRWRLEPKDPAAYARGELVEPVQPIVYYLDPATPAQWRPYFKKGIEDWNEAFEAAGFKNAIIARDPPSPEEDPDFSPEDARYSTVRYVANLTRNAMGPSVTDPRTGQIIESDIVWYHNHIRSYRNRLMIETGAANPDARSLRIPEALIGETMRQVIAHEIGHALGLPHNMIASSAYPVDSLRSPSFTHRMGISPSIMDYARQNYVAQPGDGDVRFVRQLGPYDRYAINWGYRIIPGADSPEAEKPTLDRWILEHADDPIYRFGSPSVDPRAQTEDIGADPVRASTLGIQNLQRVVPNLIDWTARDGYDYEDLDELYGELVGMWNRYVGHVVTLVGGVYETRKTSDQEGAVYEVVPEARQRAAMDFLDAQVFTTPTWLHHEPLLRRIEHAGAVERIRRIQARHLNDLLDPPRMQRLIEAEVFHGDDAYTLLELLDDVRASVWSELARAGAIDTYRRNLQRAYLARMEQLMTEDADEPSAQETPVSVSQSDIRPFVRGQLEALRQDVQSALNRTRDRATRYHLQDALARIDSILDPET